MRIDEQAPILSRGIARPPAAGLVTVLIGYARDQIAPGEPLPGAVASDLRDVLDRCDEVTLVFNGKLGDTLLAFGAVAAVLSYLTMARPDRLPAIGVHGPHATLFERLGLLECFDVRSGAEPLAATSAVVIGDRHGVSRSHDLGGRVLATFVCDPEDPPCWSSGPYAYPSLPARYFLSVEQQLGVRLTEQSGFMPTLHVTCEDTQRATTGLALGVVTATSWPMRKDYGASRFLEALRRLAIDRAQQIHALIIPGKEGIPAHHLRTPSPDVAVEVLADTHYSRAAERLAACDLVVGNDTGLTHLAAATRRPDGGGPQVIGLHARHSHGKWRTGLDWHHAIATSFSQLMHRKDLCPVRDRIDDRAFGAAADIGSVDEGFLADAARAVLTLNAEVGP